MRTNDLIRLLFNPLALIAQFFLLRLDLGGDAPPPPDYTPVAQASKETAEISAALGREQLAEGKRQYDQNAAVAKPVVDAQLAIMQQGLQQGNDYNEYSKSFRPLEQQLVKEAAAGTEAANTASRDAITNQAKTDAQTLRERAAGFESGQAADIALATGGNQGIADRFGADIENDVGTSMADARVGQTQALATAARTAARYGLSVPTNMQQVSNQNAAQLAAAANNTRTASTNNYRNLIASGIGLKRDAFTTGTAATTDAMNRDASALSADRNMRIQDQSLDFARKLDVTGMSRGLPGASSGAYSVATNAGNSAVNNQMAPGAALQGSMAQSANTQLQGRQMALTGLSSVMNAQGQYAQAAADSGGAGGLGSLLGGAASLYTAFGSDRRLKDDIELVGVDEATGLNLYEFSYTDDPDNRRYEGVMAQEVQRTHPWAVTKDPDGNLLVIYDVLGIEMKEVV